MEKKNPSTFSIIVVCSNATVSCARVFQVSMVMMVIMVMMMKIMMIIITTIFITPAGKHGDGPYLHFVLAPKLRLNIGSIQLNSIACTITVSQDFLGSENLIKIK